MAPGDSVLPSSVDAFPAARGSGGSRRRELAAIEFARKPPMLERSGKGSGPGAFGRGDVWTWTAIGADAKLIATWMAGNRHGAAAEAFIGGLAPRLANRVQFTTDGLEVYGDARPIC